MTQVSTQHLTMDALLALREPAVEPGAAAAREHIQACAHCQAELERLHQRVARLRALPALRPPRDRWPVVEAQMRATRRSRQLQVAGMAALALAASLVLVVFAGRRAPPAPVASAATTVELRQIMQRSQALEERLASYNPDARVIDGRTVSATQALEGRIAQVDRALETAKLAQQQVKEEQVLQLWRARVQLLGALVNVHVTGANYTGE